MRELKFSMILATVDRRDLVNQFLEGLKNQIYKNFEIVIVDQSDNNLLENDCIKYSEYFEVKYIKSKKGLSRSRNEGLKFISGDIVSFPDDDCIYKSDLLWKVNQVFINDIEKNFISIKMTNSYLPGRKINENVKSQLIVKKSIFSLVSSISMFVRKEVIDEIGGFDENIGLGSGTVFNGGEDYDFPLKAINKNHKIYYINDIDVLHPWDDIKLLKSKNELEKAYKGGASEMYILNKFKYGFYFKFKRCIRRIFVMCFHFMKFDFYNVRVSFNILKGMLSYFNYHKF